MHRRIFIWLVGDDGDFLRAFRRDLPRDHVDRQPALMALTAGHCDGVIEQNLVGDVGVRRDGETYRERATVIVGAVAEILEDVAARRERRLADPVRALPAHMGVALGRAIHPLRHEMAADAGISAHAVRHARRRVVRTAGAEIWDAHRGILGVGEHGLRLFEAAHALLELFVAMIAQNARADRNRNVVRIERGLDREQPVGVLVFLADHRRLVCGAVEFLAHLHFNERALLLDDDDHVETARKFHEPARLDRPRARDLIKPQAEIVGLDLVDTEIVPGLPHVEIRFADGDDADLGVRSAGRDDTIELVGAQESQHRVAFMILQARFLFENAVAYADVEPLRRHHVIVRRDDLDAIDMAVDRSCRFDRILQAFYAGPHARIARQSKTVNSIIQNLLHAGGRQDRHHHVHEMEIGLVRGRRRFCRVVVAHQREHTAILAGAGKVGVAENVAAAIDARPFAVPDRKHAIVFALAANFGLLRTPDRCRRQILVEARHELNVVRIEHAFGAMHLHIDAAERGTAIAGDQSRRVEPREVVTFLLHEQETHDCLRAGGKDAVLGEVENVVQGDLVEGLGDARCRVLRAEAAVKNFARHRTPPARPDRQGMFPWNLG